jgi:hypothetical protein
MHEMCHAFLPMYSCFTNDCYNRFKNGGKASYGLAWQKLAATIKQYARQKFSLQLDLTRHENFAEEIVIADESFNLSKVCVLAGACVWTQIMWSNIW